MSNQEWANIELWLEAHPFLKEIGNLHRVLSIVSEGFAAESLSKEVMEIKINQDMIRQDYARGIPVLSSLQEINLITETAGNLLIKIVNALVEAELPPKMLEQANVVKDKLNQSPEYASRLITWAAKDEGQTIFEEFKSVNEGFINFLAWSSLSASLKPLREVTGELLEEKPWRKGYCPLCGHLPAMGQLVRTKRGRERDLICGCCKMKWTYRRIGCPYCGNENVNTLKLIEFADIPEMRLDTCEECKAYVKTYINQGNEQVALADWSTLHLDLVGKNNGYQRVDDFFYEL